MMSFITDGDETEVGFDATWEQANVMPFVKEAESSCRRISALYKFRDGQRGLTLSSPRCPAGMSR
jgi:hypothetical protein